MGKVGQVVPVAFAQAASSPIADDAVVDGAKIMAATLLDLARTQPPARHPRSVS